MRVRPLAMLLLLLLLLLMPRPGAAQGVEAVELTAGWAGWSGDDLDDAEPGLRLQGTVFTVLRGDFDLGLTGTYGFVGVEGLDSDVRELGITGTVRYSFGPIDSPHLFLEGQVGWSRLSVDIPNLDLLLDEHGIAAGPGIGVYLPVGPTVGVVLRADVHWHDYGDVRFRQGPQLSEGGDSAWRWGAKVGVSFLRGG